MKTTSQRQKILKDLDAGYKLTQADAARLYGCWRLSARIHELREQGHPVKTEFIKRNDATFACYYMDKSG
jgi:hypothetical protein